MQWRSGVASREGLAGINVWESRGHVRTDMVPAQQVGQV